jgi:hypothetical protein
MGRGRSPVPAKHPGTGRKNPPGPAIGHISAPGAGETRDPIDSFPYSGDNLALSENPVLTRFPWCDLAAAISE